MMESRTEPIRVCQVDDLEVGQARRFDIAGHRLAVVRGEDCWYAIGDECSHADYSLADGEADLFGCTLECPKHGSLFSLETGEPETLPATRAVPVYETATDGGEVFVVLSKGSPDAAEAEEQPRSPREHEIDDE